jgi:hypothetical protein
LHHVLLTRRRRGVPANENSTGRAPGPVYGPWRQAEVLQEPRVQLSNGLDSTKDKPTSVPTTPKQSSAAFHPLQVGNAGGELSRNSGGDLLENDIVTKATDAACELGHDTAGIAAGEVVGTEILVAGAVGQHVIGGG